MMKHTKEELIAWQKVPLDVKIQLTKTRIMEWVKVFGTDGVYVSFSGGKDSTVLLDIVRNEMGMSEIPAVFVDTGLEYPEIREFVKSFENVEIIKPKMNFKQVIQKYGYPFISKEVSECVSGARKYLTRIREENSIATDRQTDRWPYYYFYDKLTGGGRYNKSFTTYEGGYDSKYRKLRGIGEYANTNGKDTRSTHKRQSKDGEYP